MLKRYIEEKMEKNVGINTFLYIIKPRMNISGAAKSPKIVTLSEPQMGPWNKR